MHLQLGSWRDRHSVKRTSLGLVLLAACARPAVVPPHLTVHWTPDPAAGRDSVAEIQLNDAMARPVTGARLELEAFMTHAGMAPVIATVDEQGNGRYLARVRFTMGGDWMVRVQGTRADGGAIDVQQHVPSVRPAQ